MTKMFSKESVIADWTANTTGTTAASGTIVDTDGYENVLVLAKLETSQAAARLTCLGGTATDAMSDYTGPTAGQVLGVAPNLYLDVHRPKKRYFQGICYASAGGQNIQIVTILYGPRSTPTSNSTLVNGLQLYTPNSGTASTTG